MVGEGEEAVEPYAYLNLITGREPEAAHTEAVLRLLLR